MAKPTGSLMEKRMMPSIVSQAVFDGNASQGNEIAIPQLPHFSQSTNLCTNLEQVSTYPHFLQLQPSCSGFEDTRLHGHTHQYIVAKFATVQANPRLSTEDDHTLLLLLLLNS
jgi:hypothetical protein